MDKDLLQRYVSGEVNNEEVAIVVDWMDEDEEHVREYLALKKLHNITTLAPLHSRSQKSHTQRVSIRRMTVKCLKIAAVILVVLSLRYIWNIAFEPAESVSLHTFIAPAGQRAELILPDSSRVWLNAQTRISYPADFGKKNRNILLDGEAYFDVRQDKKLPFVINTEKVEIAVLGTEFNVLAYSGMDSPEVSLLRGSVQLTLKETGQHYKMEPNEHIVVNNNHLNRATIPQPEYFKWKEGLLCFQNESVASIFRKLELYFDVRFDIRDHRLLTYHYSGKFRVDDGVEQVLKVLQLEHKFTYLRDREQNIITIK